MNGVRILAWLSTAALAILFVACLWVIHLASTLPSNERFWAVTYVVTGYCGTWASKRTLLAEIGEHGKP